MKFFNFFEKLIEENKDIYYLPVQPKSGSPYVNSKYFRRLHNSLIYKLALDPEYHKSFIAKLKV
jgi:hypothetical protein